MFIGVQHGEKGGVLKSSKISKLLMEHKHYSYPKAFIIMLSCLQNQMTSFYHRFFFFIMKRSLVRFCPSMDPQIIFNLARKKCILV